MIPKDNIVKELKELKNTLQDPNETFDVDDQERNLELKQIMPRRTKEERERDEAEKPFKLIVRPRYSHRRKKTISIRASDEDLKLMADLIDNVNKFTVNINIQQSHIIRAAIIEASKMDPEKLFVACLRCI